MKRCYFWVSIFVLLWGMHAHSATDAPPPFIFSGGSGSGDTHYVSPSGSGTACTDPSPCSLDEGLSQAQPNETVLLKNGTYTQRIETVRSGTSGNHIIIKAENKHQAIVRGDSIRTVWIRDNYITIDGLRIETNGSNIHCLGMTTAGGVHHAIIENIHFFHCSAAGVRINAADLDVEDVIIRNSLFDGSGHDTTNVGSGIYIGTTDGSNPDGFARRFVIYNNDILDFSSNCLDSKASTRNVWFYGNTCRNDTDRGFPQDGQILLQGSANYAYNNIIRNIDDNGPALSIRMSRTGTPNRAYNNIVYNSSISEIIDARGGTEQTEPQVYNNTFFNLSGYNVDESAFNIDVRNNIGVAQSNNLAVPPSNYFVDAANGDFHLTALAINAIDQATGDPFSSLDFDGTAIIGGTRDYGAFERAAAAPGTYVATNGSGSACSAASPCSLTTGLNQVGNGEILWFNNGTYPWFETQTNNVTYRAINQHQAIIENDNPSGTVSAIRISHNGTVIDGLRITGGCVSAGDSCGGGQGHGLVRWFASSNTTIRNSIIEQSAGALLNICGSHSSNCDNILVEDNIIRNSGYNSDFGEGIYVAQFQGNNTVNGVTIRRNTISGVGCEQALDVKPGGLNVETYHNIFENQALRSGNGCNFNVDGVIVVQGEVIFRDNIVRNNALSTSAFRIPPDGSQFFGNVIYGNTHTGAHIRERSGGSGAQTTISNNVFCSNSNNTISGAFSLSGNTFGTGTPAPDCEARENEILALIGGEPPPPPPPPGDDDIVSDLIAHLKFDSNLTDSAGPTTWTYPVGTPTYETGQIGNALVLDGTEYVIADSHFIQHGPNFTRLFPTTAGNPFTVAAWVKTTATGTVVASAVAEPTARDFQIAVSASDMDYYMRGVATSGLPHLDDGNWHHVAVTWDQNIGRVYHDAVLVVPNLGVGAEPEDTGELITIGARTGGGGFLLTGSLDDVRIYARALDPAAVTALFNLTEDPDVNPPTAPSGLQVIEALTGQLDLSWTASVGDPVGEAITYHVERCQGAACTPSEIDTTSATQYFDSGLTASTLYRYRVRASDPSNNFSGYTSIEEATTTGPVRRAERQGVSTTGGTFQ